MLTFFRRIRLRLINQAMSDKVRKSLFGDGATSKYILYAIGEIALVVIGILIALQVNNWNEHRKQQLEEQVILQSLREEISENQQTLQAAALRAENVRKACLSILPHIGPSEPLITKAESDSLMRFMTARITAEVSQSILNDLLVSGRIHLIQNNELKQQLTAWVSIYTDEILEEQGYIIHFTQNQIIPFLIEKYSFATEETKREIGHESSFEMDHREIYRSTKFENLVLNKEINYISLIDSYEKVVAYNKILLDAIARELNSE